METPSNTCFLKLPYFSRIITKEIRWAIYKEALDIKLAHPDPHYTNTKQRKIQYCHNMHLANCPVRYPNIC